MDNQKHINSRLKGATLVEEGLLHRTKNKPIQMFPDMSLVKIGGQSFVDYGRKAVYPLVEEIVEVNKKKEQVLYVTGGGTRARHVYDICLDLGLPSGVLATLGEQIANQNAIMLFCLLAKHGAARLNKDQIDELPQFLQAGFIPIMNGMPPFHWWNPPPEIGSVPRMRTDSGAFLLADTLGAKQLIFVKDVKGCFTDNPRNNPNATFIPSVSAQELLDMNLPDYPVEKPVLEMLSHSAHIKQIQIINGREYGNLTRALAGEHVGTIIYSGNQPPTSLRPSVGPNHHSCSHCGSH